MNQQLALLQERRFNLEQRMEQLHRDITTTRAQLRDLDIQIQERERIQDIERVHAYLRRDNARQEILRDHRRNQIREQRGWQNAGPLQQELINLIIQLEEAEIPLVQFPAPVGDPEAQPAIQALAPLPAAEARQEPPPPPAPQAIPIAAPAIQVAAVNRDIREMGVQVGLEGEDQQPQA